MYCDDSIHKSSIEIYFYMFIYNSHPWYNIPYHASSVKEYLTHPSMLIYVSPELFQDTSYLCWIIVRN